MWMSRFPLSRRERALKLSSSWMSTAMYGATLDSLSPDTWRAHWSKEVVNYYLSNFDGASEEAITAAAELLMGQN